MRIKVSEATDKVLDYLVAKAEYTDGREIVILFGHSIGVETAPGSGLQFKFWPSTDWAQGGPIIDREGILLRPLRRTGHELDGQCLAMYDGNNTGTMVNWVKRTSWPRHYLAGPTPLIAAMRCFVVSKLGDEVEVPKELL